MSTASSATLGRWPTYRQYAIAFGGVVVSAPTVNVPEFDADGITISDGPFDEQQARSLAAFIAEPMLVGAFAVDSFRSL